MRVKPNQKYKVSADMRHLLDTEPSSEKWSNLGQLKKKKCFL